MDQTPLNYDSNCASNYASPDALRTIRRGPSEYGPYCLADIRQYVSQGSILHSDYVWVGGTSQWITVQAFLEATAAALTAVPGSPPAPVALDVPTFPPEGIPNQFPTVPAAQHIPAAAPAAGNALTWPFHEERWIASVWIPLLWWFLVPVFPIGIIAGIGWMLEAIGRRAHNTPSLLPQSRDLGRMLAGGLLFVGSYIVWLIVPLILLSVIFSWNWVDAQWHFVIWLFKWIAGTIQHTPHEDFATFVSGEERTYLLSEFVPIIYTVFAVPLFIVGMVRYAVTKKAGSYFRIFSNLALMFRHLGGVLLFLILSTVSYFVLGVAVGVLSPTGVGIVPAIFLVGAELWVLAYLAGNLATKILRDKAVLPAGSL